MTSWFDTANRFGDPMGAARIATYLTLLDRYPPGHLVGLGAGHGGFSRLAVRRGWRVTAIDARDARFGTDTDIEWVVSDVRDFDRYDDVDLVVCLGLWYHLSPGDQVALAACMAPRPVILDTHVAAPVQANPDHEAKMSKPVELDGMRGRFYDESGFEGRATASWGNRESFWPDLPSLQQQFFGAGYETFEVFAPAYTADRTFYVAGMLGDAAAKRRLDTDIATVTPLRTPDAAPSRQARHTLAQPLPLAPSAAGSDAKVAGSAATPPVRAASAALGRSLVASGRRRVRSVRRAAARRGAH